MSPSNGANHGNRLQRGRFCAIYFKEDTTINAVTAENYTGNSLGSEAFVADSTIYGVFTSIQLSSGACIAYRI